MGFCLPFGNVAIAAHYARVVKKLDRVLIVDWDVHHGNGTQALVEDDAGIHFVSMHQWPWYPGTGAADDRGAEEQRVECAEKASAGAAARKRYVGELPLAARSIRGRGRIHARSRDHFGGIRLTLRRSARRVYARTRRCHAHSRGRW